MCRGTLLTMLLFTKFNCSCWNNQKTKASKVVCFNFFLTKIIYTKILPLVKSTKFFQVLTKLKNANINTEEPKKQPIVAPKPPLPSLPKAPIAALPPMKVEPANNKTEEGASKTEISLSTLNNSNHSAMALLAAAAASRIPENKKELE